MYIKNKEGFILKGKKKFFGKRSKKNFDCKNVKKAIKKINNEF